MGTISGTCSGVLGVLGLGELWKLEQKSSFASM